MMPAIQVQGLSFAYGASPVLHGVDLEVGQGEFFVIIGPNGSGKTSLLRVLAGLARTYSGRMDILGQPIRERSPRSLARSLALVPQKRPELCPFTVREAVLMGRAPHLGMLGMEGASDLEAAARAMAITRVADLADRPLERLSGGEMQRVLIARALCQEPEILLLDEPTASLDLAHQVRIMDLLEGLCRGRGLTVVMVSHDLNLAAMYGDRLLLLKDGRVLRTGTPSEVLTFESLEAAYGCVLLADKSPLGDFPRIIPVPGRYLGKGEGGE